MGEVLAPLDDAPTETADGRAEAAPGPDGLTLLSYPLLVDEGRLSERADELKEALADAPFVELHPDDASAVGVSDGDDVVLTTSGGVATLLARVTEHIAKGAIFVPFNQAGLEMNRLLSGDFVSDVTISKVEELAEAGAEA
jgi:predicted molibdopterin-dependent oxidoreductase YjgC